MSLLIGPFLFLFTGRTRREAPLDAHRPECGAYGTISPEHCVESILSEILIESMEHLMHLSEKTPSNLRTSENGCREKYQSFMNSPSTLACCQNPMGLEKAVRHNFYNHSALLQYSMVCEEFLTTNYSNLYDFSSSPMEGSCKNDQKGSIHFGT